MGSNKEVFTKGLVANQLNWVSVADVTEPVEALAKIRYGAKEAKAQLLPNGDGTLKVLFPEMQRAVTPGQSVVFYEADGRVLGGGIICQSIDE